jgi:hypothetical protein
MGIQLNRCFKNSLWSLFISILHWFTRFAVGLDNTRGNVVSWFVNAFTLTFVFLMVNFVMSSSTIQVMETFMMPVMFLWYTYYIIGRYYLNSILRLSKYLFYLRNTP